LGQDEQVVRFLKAFISRQIAEAERRTEERIVRSVERLMKLNEESEDYLLGEHWSTYGYPLALKVLLVSLDQDSPTEDRSH
jgi:hypothetical protein